MKSTIWTEILSRIQGESPRFFIVLRWIFGVLAAIAIIVKWIITRELWTPQDAKVMAAIQEVCGYILTAASTMWFSSLLPVKDSNTTTPTTTQPTELTK